MLYGIKFDDDSDDDEYVPIVREEVKQKRAPTRTQNVEQIWREMQMPRPPSQKPIQSALEVAQQALSAQKQECLQKVMFAGREFIVNSNGEVQQPTNEEPPVLTSIEVLRQQFRNYHRLLGKISTKVKKVNAIGKSRLDWKQFKHKHKIEHQMEQNRKGGGVIGKKNFLSKKRNM